MNWLYFILIGAAAGWLAGQFFKGSGFGLIGNLVVGIIGGVVGGFLSSALGINLGGGIIGSLITAVAGALILLWVANLIKK